MNTQNMGDLICTLRKRQNMTQKELADAVHVTDKAVSKWERGISCPDIRTIPRLAALLNTSAEELLSLQESASAPAQALKISHIITLALKAVGMAMGIAVLVLSLLHEIQPNAAVTLLAAGVMCLGIAQLQNE